MSYANISKLAADGSNCDTYLTCACTVKANVIDRLDDETHWRTDTRI
jgi:hypothetical protein